jgi:hypothetical protein
MKLVTKDKSKEGNNIQRILKLFKVFVFTIGLFVITFAILGVSNNQLFFSSKVSNITSRINAQFANSDIRIASASESITFIQEAFKGAITIADFPKINISSSHKNVVSLNNQIEKDFTKYVKVDLNLLYKDSNRKISGKIRKKGDRKLHFENFADMSYRVNLSGDYTFNGVEEFSIQKPIIRNYSWEYLASEILKNENMITLKQGPIFLSFNGDNRGLYSYEEVPSKITLERQKKKDGPIFGLEEDLGTVMPYVVYDVYDKDNWLESGIYKFSFDILNDLSLSMALDDRNELNNIIENNFDLKQWAKYFALIDIFGTYHGSVPKSVKFYYNPVSGRFEPLAFDLHFGAGSFKNFILLDLILHDQKAECEWLCEHKDFYFMFLNNPIFLKAYLEYLEKFATDSFYQKISNTYKENFKEIDQEFYSRFMPADQIFHKGLLPYFFKIELIDQRIDQINKKNNLFKNSGAFINLRNKIISVQDKSSLNNQQFITESKVIRENDYTFKGEELIITEPTVMVLTGSTNLSGISKNKPLKISGPLTIIHQGGTVELNNVIFSNNTISDITNRNISGILNLFQTSAHMDNITFENNISEDALNLISSKFEIGDITFSNIFSDALDSDFSDGKIKNISCYQIFNDCFDASDSNIHISMLFSNGVKDKSVSAGENSSITIDSANVLNTEIGMVAKDGSDLIIDRVLFENTKLYGAAYIKKSEYKKPSINIKSIKNNNNVDSYFMVANDISFKIDQEMAEVRLLSSDDIFMKLYGNEFGTKTVK